jgi:hypothetical protein
MRGMPSSWNSSVKQSTASRGVKSKVLEASASAAAPESSPATQREIVCDVM